MKQIARRWLSLGNIKMNG